MKYIIFKYLWLIAVLPKVVQLPVLGVVFLLAVRGANDLSILKYNFKSDKYFTLLIVCNAIYAFSIIASSLTGQYPLNRLFAAVNTFSITCVALGFYQFYSRVEVDLARVGKYMFVNINILLGLCILYYVIGDYGNLPLLGTLSGWDQVQGVDTTRFVGYLEYPNLTVFMYLYCYAFAVDYMSRKMNKILLLGIELLYIVPMVAANSRTGVVCGLAMLMVSALLTKFNAITDLYLKHKRKIWAAGAILLVLACVLLHKQILSVLEGFLSFRAGSTATRSMIYSRSLEKMLTESPAWGCGIKPIIPGTTLPYGSHSTYLGMFYKTGILGGSIYLLATGVAVWDIIKRKDRCIFDILISFSFLVLFAFALLEDIDGSNWSIVMFMALFALCFKSKNTAHDS